MTLYEAISNTILAQWRDDFDEAMVAWDRDVEPQTAYTAIYSFGTLVVLDEDPENTHAAHEAWRWMGDSWLIHDL